MTLPSIELNGIDPAGEEPPDEVLYHPSEDVFVDLTRTRDDEWRLAIDLGDGASRAKFRSFDHAFSAFTKYVKRHHEEEEA